MGYVVGDIYGIPMVRMFLFQYSELYGRLIFQKVTLLKPKNSMESKHSFYATLTANVFLDDNDFYYIKDVFANHYDATIRMASNVGGFLHGFHIRRTPFKGMDITNEDRVVEFTSRQLGLVLKSFEMLNCEQASRLNLMFHKIASEMAIQQRTINKNINGWTTDLKK